MRIYIDKIGDMECVDIDCIVLYSLASGQIERELHALIWDWHSLTSQSTISVYM